MGYTHYWRSTSEFPPAKWEAAILDIKKIVNNQRELLAYEYNQPSKPPAVTKVMVRFNGRGEEGHETFLVKPKDKDFQFCKTARKPYDLAVCACLIAFKKHLGADIELSSDGDWDEEWKPARQLCVDLLGYSADDLQPTKADLTRRED